MSENVQTLNHEGTEGTVQIDLREIIKKTQEDNNFKKALIENPREILHQIGAQVPADVEVKVVEESPKVRYLVLPMNFDEIREKDRRNDPVWEK